MFGFLLEFALPRALTGPLGPVLGAANAQATLGKPLRGRLYGSPLLVGGHPRAYFDLPSFSNRRRPAR